MAAKIQKMPGVHCRYYRFGACALEECRNPGQNVDWRCREIVRLLEAWDLFLAQSDNFQLSEEEATRLWYQRLEHIPGPGAGCEKYTPTKGCSACSRCGDTPPDTPIDCKWAVDSACVWELPRCEGVCRHFSNEVCEE